MIAKFKFYPIFIFLLFSNLAKASQDSTYNFNWLDPDKEVYVLQNRKFRKVGKAYLHIGGGITTSGAFDTANVVQGRAGYFFHEDFGIEFLYAKNSSKTNDTFESVRSIGVVPFVRLVSGYYGGMFMWSPFYNKINTFDKILYFDWKFGLGYGQLTEENNRTGFNANDATAPLKEETHSTILWGTGLRFYGNELLSVRVDFTGAHYQAPKARQNSTEKVWYENFDLTVGLSFAF